MACRGICPKHKAPVNTHMGGHYPLGHKRCTTCQLFIIWPGKMCPCCNKQLRTGAHQGSKKKRNKTARQVPETQVIAS